MDFLATSKTGFAAKVHEAQSSSLDLVAEDFSAELSSRVLGGWTFDPTTGVMHLNSEACALLGYEESAHKDLDASSIQSLVHPDDFTLFHSRRESFFSGTLSRFDVTVRMRHKSAGWVLVRSWSPFLRRPRGCDEPAARLNCLVSGSVNQVIHGNATGGELDFLEELIGHLPAVVFQLTRDCNGFYSIEFLSASTPQLMGYAEEEIVLRPRCLLDRADPHDLRMLVRSAEISLAEEQPLRLRIKASGVAFGMPRVFEIYATPQRTPQNGAIWRGFVVDVTDKAALEEDEHRQRLDLEATLNAVSDSLLTVDAAGRIINVRTREAELFGNSPQLLLGQSVYELIHLSHREMLADAYRRCLEEEMPQRIDFSATVRDRLISYECSMLVKQKGGSTLPEVVFSLRDVTARREADRRTESLVYFDPLTGLLNRRGLFKRLEETGTRRANDGSLYALMFIDLDNFKTLNDSQGHHVGDDLLQDVARRIRGELRSADLLARLGGDEFIVIMMGLRSNSEAATMAGRTAERIRSVVAQEFTAVGRPYQITCSIGVAFSGAVYANVAEVMKHADIAMYQAKDAGRNSVRFFNFGVDGVVAQRARMEQDLRQALQKRELMLNYQPIVDSQRNVRGYEALVRWTRDGGDIVSPAEFIPLAEQTGLIIPLGLAVLEQACLDLQKLEEKAECQDCFVSVNVSARQIQADDFLLSVTDVLQRTRCNPSRIKLELTESMLQVDIEATISKLNALRDLGIQLSLDDFGTGYSSMAYLRKLPLNELKIDRSFVCSVTDSADDAAIVAMIQQLAVNLQIRIVAEGVEKEDQFAYLHAMGCDFYQGYLFGKPQPIDSQVAFLLGDESHA